MTRFQTSIVSLNTKEIESFKNRINSYPRMAGYYIIDFLSVNNNFPTAPFEEAMDQSFEHFDDQDWSISCSSSNHQSWLDYQTDEETAKSHFIESLVGGAHVGHTKETIPAKIAEDFWHEYVLFFDQPRLFFRGLGLGNSEYAFQNGIAIWCKDRIGVCLVIESD